MLKSSNLSSDLRSMIKPNSLIEQLKTLRPFMCPFDIVLSHITNTNEKKILDIGCGDCSFLLLINKYKNFKSLSGIDINISEKTFNICKANNICVYKSNSLDVFNQEKYDVVTIIDVLHHIKIEERIYFIQGAFKLVKPGGQLVIKDMNDRPIFHALMNRIHDLIFARESINYFNFKELENYLESSDFNIIKRGKKIMFFYSHYWLFCRKQIPE